MSTADDGTVYDDQGLPIGNIYDDPEGDKPKRPAPEGAPTSHLFFITMGSDGYYGMGHTLTEARKGYRLHGGRHGKKGAPDYREYVCISKRPFAPIDREATDEEADAWVTGTGGIRHVRCECHELI